MMVRTRIWLPLDLHRRLERWARERNISLAEAGRRCVTDRLNADDEAPSRAALVREAMATAGSYRDSEGRADVAQEHDAEFTKAYRK